MRREFVCPCGENNPLNFYRYRAYECKPCLRKKVYKGSDKPPACKCGQTDPEQFYKRSRTKCKACVALHNSKAYRDSMADDEKRTAKIKYNLEYQKKHVFRYRCRAAEQRAKKRDMTFDLDEDFLVSLYEEQGGKCIYSGIEFDLDDRYYTWSIDRVDSSKGYTRDNVVLACAIVNSMKSDLGLAEFKRIVGNIHRTLA